MKLENDLINHLEQSSTDKLGLMLGKSGIALLFASHKERNYQNRVESYCNDIIDRIEGFSNTSLSNGISGFSYLLHYLNKRDLLETNDHLSTLDNLSFLGFNDYVEKKEFDYLHGYLGILNLFCENSYFERIDHDKIFSNLLIFLKNGEKFYPSDHNSSLLAFKLNLGLAHGLPSILSVLINVDKIRGGQYKPVIQELAQFVYNCRFQGNEFRSVYPGGIPLKSNDKRDCRLAWCYGDLGIGLVLLKASRYLDNIQLEQLVLQDLLKTTVRKSYTDTMISDASFCHGSSGAMYIYSKLYSEYRNNEFLEAYKYWRDFTYKIYKTNGVKGFLTYYKAYGFQFELGLLEGITGIYLAFFQENIDVEVFDRLFLIDFE